MTLQQNIKSSHALAYDPINSTHALIKVVAKSTNKKTGAITQTYTSANTCPARCPFKNNGCYASSGPCALVWKKLQAAVTPKSLPIILGLTNTTNIIRHNVAGDIAKPGTSDLDIRLVRTLTEAYKEHTAYTYTHCEVNERNIKIVKWALKHGFVINFSCENMEQVRKCHAAAVPCVLTVEAMESNSKTTEDNIVLVKCPNQYRDNVTCASCGLCTKNHWFVVCFEAHGTGKKKAINSGKLFKL